MAGASTTGLGRLGAMPALPSSIERALAAAEPRLRALFQRHAAREPGLDVDELVQEARIRLWKALDGEKNIDSLASYLQKIVTSVFIDALRRRAARPEDSAEPELEQSPAPTSEAPEHAAAQAERAQRLRQALAALHERRRQPTLLLLQGFSTVEISRLMQITEATARNLAYRGVEDLKIQLAAAADEALRDD